MLVLCANDQLDRWVGTYVHTQKLYFFIRSQAPGQVLQSIAQNLKKTNLLSLETNSKYYFNSVQVDEGGVSWRGVQWFNPVRKNSKVIKHISVEFEESLRYSSENIQQFIDQKQNLEQRKKLEVIGHSPNPDSGSTRSFSAPECSVKLKSSKKSLFFLLPPSPNLYLLVFQVLEHSLLRVQRFAVFKDTVLQKKLWWLRSAIVIRHF